MRVGICVFSLLRLNQLLTLHIQFKLASQARNSRNEDLTGVASRVGLLGVIDVQRDVIGGHAVHEADTALKLGATQANGAFCVGDDLDEGARTTCKERGQQKRLVRTQFEIKHLSFLDTTDKTSFTMSI